MERPVQGDVRRGGREQRGRFRLRARRRRRIGAAADDDRVKGRAGGRAHRRADQEEDLRRDVQVSIVTTGLSFARVFGSP